MYCLPILFRGVIFFRSNQYHSQHAHVTKSLLRDIILELLPGTLYPSSNSISLLALYRCQTVYFAFRGQTDPSTEAVIVGLSDTTPSAFTVGCPLIFVLQSLS